MSMKKLYWPLWIVITLIIGGFYAFTLFKQEDKSSLLIGDATYGHYQIEMACSTCHTDAFGGKESLQTACVNCHKQELDEAHDSHPRKKFTDPRNANMLETLDARYCISCHSEHQKEQTHAMGLTLPQDYCFHCHKDIGKNRPSHKGLAFDSCASSGCHNYHDNRALYESFLLENAGGVWLKDIARIGHASKAHADVSKPAATEADANKAEFHPDITAQWLASSHAEAGVNCSGCHSSSNQSWIEKPGINECQKCHNQEADGFRQGKHGMRLAQALPAISPMESRLPFQPDRLQQQHSCTACHNAHDFNTQQAATTACLGCHADEHSRAFPGSPHGQLQQQASNGKIPLEESVSCATCHMPRLKQHYQGQQVMRVEHNQNWNLRPNEKMIRSVCIQCHNLAFSIDALADPVLLKNNFTGKPASHVPSIDWAQERDKQHESHQSH